MWAVVNSVLHVAAAIFEHVLLVSEDSQFKDAERCNRMSYYLYAPPIGHGIIALVMVALAVFPKVSMRLIATLHGVRGLMLLAITVVIQLHQSTCYNDEELTAELTEDQWLVKCYSVLYVTSVYFSSGLTLKWSFPISTAFIITVNVLSLFNTFTNMEVSEMLYVLLQIALVLLFNFKCAYVGYWNERRRRLGYVTRNSIIKERKRNNDLLYEMIPESIVPKLLMNARNAEKGGGAVCEIYENTTVMFVYVANYSTLVKTTEPFELVRLLNTLYSKLDGIIEGSDVTKMDAVGGVYIGVAGCPTPCERHCEAIAEAALNIMELADSGALGIDLKIGIHTGPVASGVLGTYSRKWSIFSDTVNTASRMASTASVKSIQLTETVRNVLEKSSEFQLKYRGKQSVKGKGEMDTYLLQNFKFPMRRSISFSAEEEIKGLANKPHADLDQKEIDGTHASTLRFVSPPFTLGIITHTLPKRKKPKSIINKSIIHKL
jgi:class 3 adenylate cyclase